MLEHAARRASRARIHVRAARKSTGRRCVRERPARAGVDLHVRKCRFTIYIMAKIPRYAWPDAIEKYVAQELLPGAKSRGISGRVSVHEQRNGDDVDFVITIRVPSTNLTLANAFIDAPVGRARK